MTDINDYHRYHCSTCGKRMELVQWGYSVFANCPQYCTYRRLTLADFQDITKRAYEAGYVDGHGDGYGIARGEW